MQKKRYCCELENSKIIKLVKVAMVNKFCVIGCKINLVNGEKGPVLSQPKNEVFGRKTAQKIFLYAINTLQMSF